MNDNNYVLDWEDEINNENAFVLIPEGDYNFTVEKFERGTFDGSEKLPPCKKAIVTFRIHGADTDITITENFLLCGALEWKLSSLFLSVGMKKHGEPLRMNWAALPMKTGRCHVYIDKYTTKDGKSGESNKIKKFYAYDEDVNTVQPVRNTPNYAQPAPSYNTYQPAYTQPVQPSQPTYNTQGGWQAGKF